jgi:citrate lyase synthetase
MLYVDPWLYDLEITKIKELVKEMTLEYIQQINTEKQAEYEQFVAQNVNQNG